MHWALWRWMCAQLLSGVLLFVAPQIEAHQAPLPMEFSRQEYRMGCHFLLQGTFLTQGLNLSLASPSLTGGFFTTSATWEAWSWMTWIDILNFVTLNQLLNLSGPVLQS